MSKKDYYQFLGVDKDADQATIKRAYRRLAMRYHPDQNPEDPDAISKMKEVNEAYAILGDPEKRRHYDAYGQTEHQAMSTDGSFRDADFASLFREFGLGDIFGESLFDMFFGHRRATRTRWAAKGPDRIYELEVTAAEAFYGTEKQIEIRRLEECPTCQGTGANYAGLVECEQCLGSGWIVREQRTGFSLFRQVTPCPVCGGRGKMIIDPCHKCQGRGVLERREKFTIRVPAGTVNGDTMKVPGWGNAGESGAAPGDLYLVLRLE